MNAESLVLHLSRSGEVQVFDAVTIPHFEDPVPLIDIAVAVISAGYSGVAIDEIRLTNGRYCQFVEADRETPEGKLFQQLSKLHDSCSPMPSVQSVLDLLATTYAAGQAQAK